MMVAEQQLDVALVAPDDVRRDGTSGPRKKYAHPRGRAAATTALVRSRRQRRLRSGARDTFSGRARNGGRRAVDLGTTSSGGSSKDHTLSVTPGDRIERVPLVPYCES